MFPSIPITDSISIPTYLLIISFAYSLGILWVVHRSQTSNLDRNLTLDLCFVIMISGFVGARLFHVFYESPEVYLNHPTWIIKVWYGGFVFYGGALTAFVASLLYLRLKKQPLAPWADLFAPVGAAGYAVGRLGCFFNGCCYGKICTLPWGFRFPGAEGNRRRYRRRQTRTVQWRSSFAKLRIDVF